MPWGGSAIPFLPGKENVRLPVEVVFPSEAFRFSGQSSLEAWTLRDVFERLGWSTYDHFLAHEPELCLQRIRELADAFPTWQHHPKTGRPPVDERVHIVAAMLRQFFHATYRQLESHLRVLREFFRIEHVPDANTLSEKNRTRRFSGLLRRFHQFILSLLPKRDCIIGTDLPATATRRRPGARPTNGLRATEDWVKIKSHSAIELPQLLYLNSVHHTGRVHESRKLEDVWNELPENVRPFRSVADAAPRTRATTVWKSPKPTAQLVNFGTHGPNRFKGLTGIRALVETTINCTKQRFGHQLRCRHPIARKNEIQAKQTAHNIRILLMRQVVHSPRVSSQGPT